MRRLATGLTISMLAFVLPATAIAQDGSRQTAELRFDETEPGTATGFRLGIDYVNPRDPAAKPPSVRRVVEEFATGTRLDTSIPGRCTASDLILMLSGPSVCPADSRVGSGTITLDTGLPLGPARFLFSDVVFLNNTNQLIFVATERLSRLRLVFRASVSESRIANSAPFLPGLPPDGAAIDVVDANIDRITREAGGVPQGYVTTPGTCPDDGAWTNSVSFTYADGVTQVVRSPSPCVRGGDRAAACANRRSGGPGRDRLRGTGAGDRFFGLGGSDRLAGAGGDDCLRGGGGGDRLKGGIGDDRLFGGPGPDLLAGGPGQDRCRGGAGRDRVRGCERAP